MSMRKLLIAVLIPLLCSACGGGGDTADDSNSGSTHTVNFTLYSSDGNLPAGRKVVYLYANCQDGSTCSQPDSPFHVYEAAVEAEGEVSISFSHDHVGYFWTSIYIDIDQSNTLNPGDLVWGTDPYKIFGGVIEFTSSRTSHSSNYTWEDIATSEFGGYSTYSGSSQNWNIRMKSELLHQSFSTAN